MLAAQVLPDAVYLGGSGLYRRPRHLALVATALAEDPPCGGQTAGGHPRLPAPAQTVGRRADVCVVRPLPPFIPRLRIFNPDERDDDPRRHDPSDGAAPRSHGTFLDTLLSSRDIHNKSLGFGHPWGASSCKGRWVAYLHFLGSPP